MTSPDDLIEQGALGLLVPRGEESQKVLLLKQKQEFLEQEFHLKHEAVDHKHGADHSSAFVLRLLSA